METPSNGSATISAPTSASQVNRRQFALLMTATSVGSLIEFYDFFLASAAAATVWPRIFFPARMDPSLALATSVASVGLAYIVRPVGAIVFGHVADKYGRRSTLVGNLLLMGIASVGTGLIPSYVSWGIFSVIMLYVFRLVIGIALGGEQGSAYSWIAEARPNAKHRGFWISWPNAVLTLGKLLSIFAFYIAASSLSSAAYVDWGWRIPFLAGGVLLGIALIIRLRTLESPMFDQLRSKRAVLKYPAFQVIKEQWRKIIVLLWLAPLTATIPALVILPYSVSYLTTKGVSDAFANLSVSVGSAMAFFAILGGALLSDHVGRLKVLRIGGIFTMVVLYPYFWLLNTLNPLWILFAQALLYGVDQAPAGLITAILAESFPTKYRASGAGLTYNLSQLIVGIASAGVLPVCILLYGVVNSWQPLVWFSIALAILAIVMSYLVKETKGVALE